MRLTFRNKLIAIVATAAAGYLALLVANVVLSRRVVREIDQIEAIHIPKLELRPALERSLEDLSRHFQDSVAAKEPEGLLRARAERDAFLAQLETNRDVLDRAKAGALREALTSYFETANSVSVRLIAGETGEPIVDAMVAMQEQQRRVSDRLEETTRFERGELSGALESVRRLQVVSFWARVAVILTSLTLVVALSTWLLAGLVRSVNGLSAGFERFGAGKLDVPIQIHANDELGALGRNANKMAESLRHSIAELEAFNYSVSHDLRAPLRPLDGFSQALLEDYGSTLDPKAHDYLKRIRAAAQRMSQLIEDMLQLSRLGRAELAVRPVDIAPLGEAIVAELRRNEPARQVEFVAVTEAKTEGDARLLRIVLENLLRNAWKFSRKNPSSRIELGVKDDAGRPVYFVRDNGAGFDPQFAGKLFQPFQRLHNGAEFEGTGIGLAIVQRIVRRHHGRVWAEGKPGEGATFFFTLHENKANS